MSVPRFWREISSRYDICGNRCTKCNKIFFPPREICTECKIPNLERYDLKGEGTIVTYTIVHVPQEGFEEQIPYVMAIIELVDGPKLTAQIVDCDPEEVEIGKKVERCFRKIGADGKAGAIYYGYKFKLVK